VIAWDQWREGKLGLFTCDVTEVFDPAKRGRLLLQQERFAPTGMIKILTDYFSSMSVTPKPLANQMKL